MATRMIVTSQPDVACDVCGRRLLRGEQPDVFLASGRRRTVCELCAPRASAEGWLRETDHQAVDLPAARPRRGRNLLGRLRQPRERANPADEGGPLDMPAQPSGNASYDFLDGPPAAESLDGAAEAAVPFHAGAPADASLEPLAPDAHEAARPVPATPLGDSHPAPVGEEGAVDASPARAEEKEEEGSWRDAWMFVKE
jgi:hypothetical protein